MADDDETPENEDNASQEDIDDIFGDEKLATQAGDDDEDEESGGGMTLEEIDESPELRAKSQADAYQYEVGEPMAGDVTAIYDIPVQISAVLGRSTMQVSQLLKLGRGAVVELDRKVGEAIDIYVNNRLVARGEVVVVEDKLGVTMTEIVKSDRG